MKGIGINIEIKVSVITPFFNCLPYLEECVHSVLAQTLPKIELILIDDGSTDGSEELADDFAKIDGRVRVIHQANKGVSAARNAGLAAARGEYIGFVDADDFVDPELYEKQYACAIDYSADIISAAYRLCKNGSEPDADIPPPFEPGLILTHNDIQRFAAGMHSSGCFLFVWRNLFANRLIAEHHIRFDEQIRIGEDTLFNMECFLRAQSATGLGYAGYHYRIHPESAMQKIYKPLLNESLQKQFDGKLALCSNFMPEHREAFMRDLAKYSITALFPVMLANLYLNDIPQKKKRLKELVGSAMIQQSFAAFDLNEIRSRSLDWLMFWCTKHRLPLPAHLLCKHVLYRK